MTLRVKAWASRLLDWRLRGALRKCGLPDLPEVRKFMRLCYWNGFTFGAVSHRLPAAREEALSAVARQEHALRMPGSPGKPGTGRL